MLELVLNYCTSFPAVTAEEKWDEEICFSVGDKMFCSMQLEPPFKLSFKCTCDQFHAMIARSGVVPMPYLARYHWVQIKHPEKHDWHELQMQIQNAYELVVRSLPPEEQDAILKAQA